MQPVQHQTAGRWPAGEKKSKRKQLKRYVFLEFQTYFPQLDNNTNKCGCCSVCAGCEHSKVIINMLTILTFKGGNMSELWVSEVFIQFFYIQLMYRYPKK